MAIDRMDWHYESVEEENLPLENAGTHIGFFLTWIIENDLLGTFHTEDETSCEYIEKVKNREITGVDFLTDMCDEKFWDEDLSEIGYEFVNAYYEDYESDFSSNYANYLDDYEDLFSDNGSIYQTENSWENYEKLKKVLDKRYAEWKKCRV